MLINKILAVLQSIGVMVDESDMNEPLNILIQDSITYVSFIVELEKAINIELPDEFLASATFNDLNNLVAAINLLIDEKNM